jgi:TIR domain
VDLLKECPVAHDVFIAYSSKDKSVADAICAGLEAGEIRCWIAPRDVGPTTTREEATTQAIEAVFREILLAARWGIPSWLSGSNA